MADIHELADDLTNKLPNQLHVVGAVDKVGGANIGATCFSGETAAPSDAKIICI